MRLIWQSVQNYNPDAICSGIPTTSECLSICQKTNTPLVVCATFPFAESSEMRTSQKKRIFLSIFVSTSKFRFFFD